MILLQLGMFPYDLNCFRLGMLLVAQDTADTQSLFLPGPALGVFAPVKRGCDAQPL